jgi:hypothetical protein
MGKGMPDGRRIPIAGTPTPTTIQDGLRAIRTMETHG